MTFLARNVVEKALACDVAASAISTATSQCERKENLRHQTVSNLLDTISNFVQVGRPMMHRLIAAFLVAVNGLEPEQNVLSKHLQDSDVVIPPSRSYNGLNKLPPMGWNNWNAYGCDVSEELLISTAKTTKKFGLQDLGYHYITMDDCWSIGRNLTGHLVPDPVRFPNGIRHLADRLHSMGYNFGMYSSAGTLTCALFPGSLDYETEDADFFADNHVDYLKYDNCYNKGLQGTPQLSFNRYEAMANALLATGRPIVYALCQWGTDYVWQWSQPISNSARMSGDIYDSFNRPDPSCITPDDAPSALALHRCSVMNILNIMATVQSKSRSGWFNDMDMLEVGNGGMDDNEYVTHFSLWAMLSSPLLMSTDINHILPRDFSIIANPAIIALNQDPLPRGASRIWLKECEDKDQYGLCDHQLWTRTMANGDKVIALINGGNRSATLTASLQDIFTEELTSGTYHRSKRYLEQTWDVHDLWANRLSEKQAGEILMNGAAAFVESNPESVAWYNSTEMSYEAGLRSNHPALFGAKVGKIGPNGEWSVDIPRHSTGLYRLRKTD